MADGLPVTQRAYTLRLRGANKEDNSWQDALWKTHEAVNKGAKAFGDWLLTLCGGLCHTLASCNDTDAQRRYAIIINAWKNRDKDKRGPEPTVEEARREVEKERRILLALSWLSVESKDGAPIDSQLVVATGQNLTDKRERQLLEALRTILAGRGVTNQVAKDWENDCKDSLSAAIRGDAVWVNRSRVFDRAVEQIGKSLTRDQIWDLLCEFFGKTSTYFAPVEGKTEEEGASESKGSTSEAKVKDLVQKAGGWLSSRFGTGKGADFAKMKNVYAAISEWAQNQNLPQSGAGLITGLAQHLNKFSPPSNDLKGILTLISGPGYESGTRNLLPVINSKTLVSDGDISKLADAARKDVGKCDSNKASKGRKPYSDAILKTVEATCGFTYLHDDGPARHKEFSVMLDHAARRVSLAHTWIKRAETQRRQFEEDSRKISNVPAGALDWLDSFCEQRSSTMGAIEGYRIRRREIDGWDKIVAAWSKADCKTEDDRKKQVGVVQAECQANDEKFGGSELFGNFAADEAVCIWQGDDGKAIPRILKDYVAAREAEAKKQRFKVPAYRHPDALLHPVFCDFGYSRWDIEFDIQKLRKNVTDRKKKKDNLTLHGLKMGLWDGSTITTDIPLQWGSKRLVADLGLNNYSEVAQTVRDVTRADRLSRAASGVKRDSSVNVLDLFEQDYWNGRLQAPRTQLDKLARYVGKHDWDKKAERMRAHLNWLISFSAKLQPQGPWVDYGIDYEKKHNTKLFERRYDRESKGNKIAIAPRNSRDDWRGLAYPFWHPANEKGRKGMAKHILSRLPGLRILSGDLGHRHAMACAVWETLSAEKFEQDCKEAEAKGAKPIIDDSGLYAMVKYPQRESNAISQRARSENHIKKFQPTTFYRRVGPDNLPDGSLHPAPWARLDRQFLIKLQGEEENARKASPEEIKQVREIENAFGKLPSEKRPFQVDELMSDVVRTLRLALKRHGDRARIAFAVTSDYKIMPGDRKYYWQTGQNGDSFPNETKEQRKTKHTEDLRNALVIWHDLASSSKWKDDNARNWWNEKIVSMGAARIETIEGVEEEESLTSAERKKQRKDLETTLTSIAEKLMNDQSLCQRLHKDWGEYWRHDDSPWKKILKDIRQLVLPRGKKLKDGSIWHAGGLSLERIATIKMLWQVMKAYRTRPEPDNPQKNIPAKDDDSLAGFGKRILDTMERMREQRVKQLASRVAASALGLGGHWKQIERPLRDEYRKIQRDENGNVLTRKRWVWQEEAEPKYPSCHTVVIENLKNYRPEETRTRRENRQLMSWSSSKVKKYLSEACQLNGIHLREVPASYTSRQDSRTGAPGIRCTDVPAVEFTNSPFWKKQITQAEKRKEKKELSARDEYILALRDKWVNASEQQKKDAPPLLIPMKGGEIFVSADRKSPAAKGIQADLNAAANIGLRALLDPDWQGRWWYVPCNLNDGKPDLEKVKGSVIFEKPLSLIESQKKEKSKTEQSEGSAKKKNKKQTKDKINAWRDVSAEPFKENKSMGHKEYQADVEKRVTDILREKYLS